jgi:23S rRNA (pseudouridine1915-N3)-methyltransferase
MHIHVISVGKTRESWVKEASAEYQKRLSAYCTISMTEISPVDLPQNPSQAQIDQALYAESEKILSKIPHKSYTVALTPEGKKLTSERFSQLLETTALNSVSDMSFIIGSTYGLSPRVKRIADLNLSLSDMTFPHRLARIMLLEQLFRGYTILNGGKYHK